MPKLQYLAGCFIFCILATSCVCTPVTVYSQIGEQSSLTLYDFFQTIRSDVTQTGCDHFTVANGAEQVAAPFASQDQLVDIVSQAQTKISSTSKALINVYIKNKYFYFSYQVITQVNSALQLSDPVEQSTNILAGKFNSIIFATSTSGYFSCLDSTLAKNYTGSFAYNTQGASLTITSLEVNFIASQLQTYWQGGVLNLIAQFSSNSIGTITFPATAQDTYTIGTQIKTACQLTGTYILGSQYSLQVCGNTIAGYTITAFYLDYQQNLVSTASSPVWGTASYDAILQTKTINGVAYILSSSLISTQFLYSTTVQLNTSDGSLSIQAVELQTPNRLLSWQFNIQSEQLLVAMTDTDILGYNLQDQTLLFALPTYSQTDYQLYQVFSSFNIYYLIFSDSTTHVTVQYSVAFPTLSYTQLNTDMTCTLSVSHGLNQVVITAKALTDVSTVSVLDNSIHEQNIQSGSSLDLSLNLEGYVIGSNLSLKAPTLTADESFTELTASISSIEKLTYDATKDTKLATLSAVVSTQTSTLLLQLTSTDNPPVNSIILSTISTDSNSAAKVSFTCSTLKLGEIIQSDMNGFISFTSTTSDFYFIALPFSSSLTDDCSLPVLTTTCSKTSANSTPFLFTSDILTSNIFTICGSVATVYTYSLSGSTLKFSSQVLAILPQQNYVVSQMIAIEGTLILTNSLTIVIYKYSVQYSNTPETTVITIPTANLNAISAIQLYSSTYLAISSTTSTIYQLPYSNQATPLRTFNYNSYIPNFAITHAIYQTLNGAISSCNEEYFVMQAQDNNANLVLLIYRLNCVSAQNQLYKILPITKAAGSSAKIFSTTGYFGFIDTANAPSFYALSYSTTLSVTATVDTDVAFASQMYQAVTGKLQISTSSTLPLNFSFQKDVSAANAIINMSQSDVALLQTYFIPYPQLTQAQPISMNLDSAVSSNIFGWISKQKSVSALFVPSISSRLSIQVPTTPIVQYFDVLPLIGNLYAHSLSTGIFIGTQNIVTPQFGNCYLQKDSSQDSTDSTTNPTQITVKITFYALCLDLTNKQQELIKIAFVGTQILSDSSITFVCDPPVVATRAAPELESTFALQKIQTDPQLGLFMLIKSNSNALQPSFCLVKMNSPAFTVDCASANLVNSLSVLDVVYIPDPNLKINLFITASGSIYTGFTLDQNNVVVATSAQSYALSSLADINTIAPVEQPLQIGGSIRDNAIIISYDSENIFELTASQSPIPNNPVKFALTLLHIFYGEDSLVFTGFGVPVSTTETVFLAIESVTSSLYFVLYSGFYSSNAKDAPITLYQTMKASAVQLVVDPQNLNGSATLFLSTSSVLSYFVNKYPGNLSSLNSITLSSTIQVSVSASESANSYSGVAFYLQLASTSYNSFNSIPVSVDIIASTTSQGILKALGYLMILTIGLVI